MSAKDFQLIADVIADLPSHLQTNGLRWSQREIVANTFADRLASTNARFNRARFLRACGVEA